MKSSRSKVKEAEDNLAEIQDGISSKTSPRSVLDISMEDNETTTDDGDNTDSVVVDDNDVKKVENFPYLPRYLY